LFPSLDKSGSFPLENEKHTHEFGEIPAEKYTRPMGRNGSKFKTPTGTLILIKKLIVGRLVSIKTRLFSGSMLIYQRVNH
jgi:hypothetical protein